MDRICRIWWHFGWLALLLIAGCGAEVATEQPNGIRVGNPGGNYVVPGTLGQIVYREMDGVRLSVDAYVQNTTEIRPGIVVLHGGRWSSGSRVAFVGQFLEMLTEAGFNWFSVDYRLAPQYRVSDSVEDVLAALEFISSNSEFFRVDPARLAVLGEDTGGHVGLLAALDRPDLIAALVAIGSPFDLNSLKGEFREAAIQAVGADPGDPDSALARFSPVEFLGEGGLPPVMVVHGEEDREIPVEQAENFCQRVRTLDETCRFLEVAGGTHRAENWLPSQWGYKEEVISWLQQQLRTDRLEEKPHEQSELRKDLVFAAYERQGEDPLELKMDAWIPAGEGPFPAVIIAHGGGWEAGDKVTYVSPLFQPLAQGGFAWFSIDYRLTPRYGNRDQLDDLRRAVRYVRSNFRQFHVDPDRIAILGESASGQMALLVAALPCPGDPESEDPVERVPCNVQAVVSFYGVYDLLSMVKDLQPRSLGVRLFGLEDLGEESKKTLIQYSPLYQVHAELPPVLLIHGTAEMLWDQALQLESRLKELNVPHALIPLEGAPHGLGNWEGQPRWEGYKSLLVDWLHVQLAR